MITIQLESEDFSAQALLAYLKEQNSFDALELSVIKAEKEGLADFHDAVQFLISDDVSKALAIKAIVSTIEYVLKKGYAHAFPDPHILLVYNNGQTKKILYAGKSDKAISQELMAAINDKEVIRVFFKS